MSGQSAREAVASRVLVVDDAGTHDVFDVVGIADGLIRVRSPFLFEVGEELRLRIEQNTSVTDAVARVRCHVGTADAVVTELELTDKSTPRTVVSG
jgi:hypothetical protein